MQVADERTILAKVLWSQVVRVLPGARGVWDPESGTAQVLLEVLFEPGLHPEEDAVLRARDSRREDSRSLYDRLLELRVNRALRSALEQEAQAARIEHTPDAPRVAIVRTRRGGGGAAPGGPTAVDILGETSGLDVDLHAPGQPLQELVDMLVLANRDAFSELQASVHPALSASFRVEAEGVEADLLANQTTPVRVFELERALARVEQVLRDAIPEAERPPEAEWSFGRDLTGQLLGGKYRIKALKGIGGFKAVYEAADERLGARVAVAVLKPKGARSRIALDNFLREAQLLTSLDHENIVRWITFDRTADGLHYFVMEYLAGEELEKILQREGKVEPARAAAILLQVLSALRRAHNLGPLGSLLHLDLKPENVFVQPALAPGEPERAKVIDFGIGQHVGAEVRAADQPELRSIFDLAPEELGRSIGSIELAEAAGELAGQPNARDGAARGDAAPPPRKGFVRRARGGTLLYASPEQCRHLAGEPDIVELDGRSDLYSVGVMAFRMLTGEFPWPRCDSARQAIKNHVEVPPRKIGSLGVKVPRRLAVFVERCLAKDRAQRFRDANEAWEFLDHFVHPRVSVARVAAPVAAVAALLIGVVWWNRPAETESIGLVDAAGSAQVERLFLGPERSSETLALPRWSGGAASLALVDLASGEEPQGFEVGWSDPERGELAVRADPQVASGLTTARLRLAAKRKRWETEPFELAFLGPWEIAGLAVSGHDGARQLDPRGRSLEVRLGGDALACANVTRVELFAGEERVQLLEGPELERARGAAGLALVLDALAGREGALELRALARDAAGMERERSVTLELAGPPASFAPATGFVAGMPREGDVPRALFGRGDEFALTGGAALHLALEGRGTVRALVQLDGAGAPIERELPIESAPFERFVALEELGIAGEGNSGTLRLAVEDSAWVDRASSTPDERAFRFVFLPAAPELAVELSAADGRSPRLLEADRRATVDVSGPARLAVRPSAAARLWISAQVSGVDAPAVEAQSDVGSGAVELTIELPAEGPCRIVVQPHLVLGDQSKGPALGPERAFEVVVDPRVPEITLALEGVAERAADGSPLVRAADPRLALAIADASSLASVSWELEGAGARRAAELDPARAELDLWPLLFPPGSVPEDGPHALRVAAVDAAGNAAQQTLAFHVARRGPELRLLEPLAREGGGEWRLSDPTRWSVEARASDPNGVREVRARFWLDDATAPFHEATLVSAGNGLFELAADARPPVYSRWTGRRVRLELDAVDEAGLASEPLAREGLVPRAPVVTERLITPRASAGAAAETPAPETMVLVTGNADGEYVFGGRRAADAGRPWHVPIEKGALGDFYLDAREVTRAEFLAFVEDPRGYADPAHWPCGAQPSEERRRELAALASAEGERAMTGVSWAEACAYARFRGKRLPTLLEWEHAVRAGAQYRTGAEDAEDGLCGLCAGPGEWTATAGRLVPGDLDFPAQCRAYPALLVRAADELRQEDLNQDRSLDLVATCRDAGLLQLFVSGRARPIALAAPAPRSVVVRDLDGDGLLDLAACGAGARAAVFLQGADGDFRPSGAGLDVEPAPGGGYRDDAHWVAIGPTYLDRSVRGLAGKGGQEVGFRCAVDAPTAYRWLEEGTWRVIGE